MPKFLITGGDGRKFMVESSDPQTAYNDLNSHLSSVGQPATDVTPQPANAPVGPKVDANGEVSAASTAEDAAKSFGAGLVKGTESLLGSMGDVRDINGNILAAGVKALGGGDQAQGIARVAGKALAGPSAWLSPTTQQVKDVAAPVVSDVNKFEPNTTVGKYAQTIGEFAPNAVLGEGGLVKKAALTIIPAVASEAAGQATQGTAAEPYARLAGALGGGLATALPDMLTAGSQVSKVLNSAAEQPAIKSEADNLFGFLRDNNIKYDPAKYSDAVDALKSKLDELGVPQELAPKAYAAIGKLEKSIGSDPSFNDINTARRIAGRVATNPDSTERFAAGQIREAIDSFMSGDNMNAANSSLAPEVVSGTLKQANELARRNILANQINDMVDEASTYQSGLQSGLQNQFANYLRSSKANGLSPEERQAFQEVAKGNFGRNLLSILGKAGVDPTSKGNLSLFGPALVADILGGHGAFTASSLAGLMGGSAAKVAARNMTEAAASNAKKTVLLGRSGQRQLAAAKAASPSLLQPQAVNALTAAGNIGPAIPPNFLTRFVGAGSQQP